MIFYLARNSCLLLVLLNIDCYYSTTVVPDTVKLKKARLGPLTPQDFPGNMDIDNNLFPNFNHGYGNNNQSPGNNLNYPNNRNQINNPPGNTWNNANGNPRINYPVNSQFFPGHSVQNDNRQYLGNGNGYNNAHGAYYRGYPNNYNLDNNPQYLEKGNGNNNVENNPDPYYQGNPYSENPKQNQYPGSDDDYGTPGDYYPENKLQGDYSTYPRNENNWNDENTDSRYQNSPYQYSQKEYPGTGNNWDNGYGHNPNPNKITPETHTQSLNNLHQGREFDQQSPDSQELPNKYSQGLLHPKPGIAEAIADLNPNQRFNLKIDIKDNNVKKNPPAVIPQNKKSANNTVAKS